MPRHFGRDDVHPKPSDWHQCRIQIPFVKRAPMVTFKKPIGSVSVSGHKFVGAPVPCGVVITRTRYIKALSSNVEYLNSRDATIMGSRNGHAPIYMWYTLTRKGYEGMRKDVEKCLRNAHLLKVRGEGAPGLVGFRALAQNMLKFRHSLQVPRHEGQAGTDLFRYPSHADLYTVLPCMTPSRRLGPQCLENLSTWLCRSEILLSISYCACRRRCWRAPASRAC